MCGIVGIYSQSSVSAELVESLIHLQHRGQDAAGILTMDEKIHQIRQCGYVREIFSPDNLTFTTGNLGIGHVRYPTSGSKTNPEEIQPLNLNKPYGIGFAHNGNLVNHHELTEKITQQNCHLNTNSDSEVLLHLFAEGFNNQSVKTTPKEFFSQLCTAVKSVFNQAKGGYAVISTIMNQGLIAFRDPNGIRPLIIGRRKSQDRDQNNNQFDYIIASETTVLYPLGFELYDNVQPGEVVFIDKDYQLHREKLIQKPFHPCVFEYVYFARPDAIMNDVSVYRARLRMGQNLARAWQTRYPDIKPDIIIPVPFTSNTAAMAFANQLGVRYSEGLYKNPFIGRTFIMPNQQKRALSVRRKLIPQETEIRDKKVLILDDSIVRGTTSREIIKMVREFGAKEVYFATSCPPVKFTCEYGIDIPTRSELIAANNNLEQIKNHLMVDRLLYLDIDDLIEAVTRRGDHHIEKPCMACLNGEKIKDCV